MRRRLAFRDQHDWRLLGGAAGWEMFGCDRCKTQRFPSVLGSLWRARLWMNRCPRAGRPDAE